MAVHTLLLDFKINSGLDLSKIQEIVLREFEFYFDGKSIHLLFSDDTSLSLYRGPLDSIITLRLYHEKSLVTVTIEYFLHQNQRPLLSYEECKILESKWSDRSEVPKNVKTLPRVLRGLQFDIYFPTTDGRLVEYDIDEVCFDEKSEFQHIQIFHSKTFGNMLVLDDDPNLAESDKIYNDYLMRRGVENYANSEILILGGGDGALLNDILKENPKNVIMIEIDELVMTACKTLLRSLCGNVLDQNSGSNYKILTGDCLPAMSDMLAKGDKFDYIFSDLTTIPISSTESNVLTQNFVQDVIRYSFQLLRPCGKYLTHGDGSVEQSAILEEMISSIVKNFKITKETAFVPSFSENWAFYSVQLLAITQSN